MEGGWRSNQRALSVTPEKKQGAQENKQSHTLTKKSHAQRTVNAEVWKFISVGIFWPVTQFMLIYLREGEIYAR